MIKSNILFPNCLARSVFRKDELGLEIAQIAIPAALALAADPIASLIDTAFIGHIGLCLQLLFFFFGEDSCMYIIDITLWEFLFVSFLNDDG